MNCYTVVNGQIQIGMALSHDQKIGYFIRLGKREENLGKEKVVTLSASSPASHILVAGGIHLMRTTQLMKINEQSEDFLFAKANYGMKPERKDSRALLLVDFLNSHGSAGYMPATYESIPVFGFQVIEAGTLFRVQALVVLNVGQHFHYYDQEQDAGYTVVCSMKSQEDRSYPIVSCMSTQQFLKQSQTQSQVVV